MMADLVHQHVLDDRAERFLVLGPVVENRPAVKPDHVRHLHRRALRAERQADALEQAEQVEFAFGAHLVEHLFAREIVDLDDDIGAQIAKSARQTAKTSPAMTSSSASEGAVIRRQASGSDAVSAMSIL